MSRYESEQTTVAGFAAYRLRDTVRQAEAVIIPELGCNCVSFRTTPDGVSASATSEPVDIFVPPADIAGLRDVPFTGGCPILFPFPNRVRDGVYTFEGHTYRMDKLFAKGWDKGAGQALHGLVGDKPWTVGETFADDGAAVFHASIQLDSFPDIAEQYPFSWPAVGPLHPARRNADPTDDRAEHRLPDPADGFWHSSLVPRPSASRRNPAC